MQQGARVDDDIRIVDREERLGGADEALQRGAVHDLSVDRGGPEMEQMRFTAAGFPP